MNEKVDPDHISSDVVKLTAKVKAGGCAAKLSSKELAAVLSKLSSNPPAQLLTGMDNFEDAAVYKISEDVAIIETIDFFPPVVDNPYLFGQIAATNALSDVYAMGGRPILALNVVGFPTCDYPLSVLEEILLGGAAQVKAAGAYLVGGHSIQTPEPLYGLSVTGTVNPKEMLTNSGARPSDKLVLSKPIGTGVALLAMKGELLSAEGEKVLLKNLTQLNDTALAAGRKYKINALTDVTGFGLIGHLHEMAKGSGLTVRLDTQSVALLPEVIELAGQGFVPAGAYGNRQSYAEFVININKVELELEDLMFDPQTSGGLLYAVSEEDAQSLVSDLKKLSLDASIVGDFIEADAERRPGVVEII